MKRPFETGRERLDDHTGCGCLDRGRGPDRVDAGGRAGAGGHRRCHHRTARRARNSPARAPAACTRAASRSSISAGSPIGSSARERWLRSGNSPASLWTSATFPPGIPTRSGCWQNHIERILAGWVDELGVTIHRGREVTGFTQDDTGVDVALSDGQSLRAQYLVGCDGGRSLIRKAAGIEFPGWDPTTSNLIAEVELAEAAGMGHPPGRPRHPWHRQGRIRDPRRRGCLRR